MEQASFTPDPDQTGGTGNEPRPYQQPVMLEGMKVLFDDKVGLYPVTLVADQEAQQQ